MIIELAESAAFLVALSFLHGLITRFWRADALLGQLASGAVFGGICVLGMAAPIRYSEGVIFDPRSVILANAGLFGGPVTAVTAGIIAASYRLWLGGGGTAVGIGVIALSLSFGLGYHYLVRRKWLRIGFSELLAFGFIVHLLCVGLFMSLPETVVGDVIAHLAVPFVTVFSAATVLLGLILNDNNQRMGLEQELLASQDRFSRAVAGANEGIWDWNVKTGENYFSPRFEDLLGYRRGELVPVIETFHDILHPDDQQKAANTIQAHLDGLAPYDVEYRLRCKNGEYKWVYVKGQAVWNEHGEAVMLAGAITDITERKAIEAELLKSRNRMFLALENIPDTVVLYDRNLVIRFVNEACRRSTGRPKSDFIGKKDEEIWPAEICDKFLPILKTALASGNLQAADVRLPGPDGAVRYLKVTFVPVTDSTGTVREIVGITHDDTERRRTEELLRQSQKMEAVGQLTGGIAHDLNNMLGVILGNLDLLRLTVEEGSEAEEYLQDAYSGGRRAASMTSKLMQFSRKDPGAQKSVNVNDFVNGMVNLIAKSLTPKVKVETRISDELWVVNVDPVDFENALLNLCLNANDAMPEGGSLVIETSNRTLSEADAQRTPDCEAGEYVVVSVSDTGVGMTQETLKQVFEPFFSTKETGKGTGLGLSMVFGFVKRSRGHIEVSSQPGAGAKFELYLPRLPETLMSRGADSDAKGDEMPRGNETILIVDDEAGLLKVAAMYLRALGYKPLTASNADEALSILAQDSGVDLVFSDVVMQGQRDGYGLGLEILKNYPGTKVLLASGFVSERDVSNDANAPIPARLAESFLRKPYTQADLAKAVRNALDADS